VHFDDPKVGVGVVAERHGRVLLVKRNHEPHMAEWSFPSGYLDRGEDPIAGAIRETKEETGLDVRVRRLLGVYHTEADSVIFIAYAASATRGAIVIGEECQDARFFKADCLPPLAFDHDDEIITAWRAAR
jgi:ADP-ribose pyrophosphatase YjhB (NUDIX family)